MDSQQNSAGNQENHGILGKTTLETKKTKGNSAKQRWTSRKSKDSQQKNAENQRKSLLHEQQKELNQLEAKIETGRHNLKIKMDKDLIILQKEIGLHVHDIERMQGLIARLATKKGETQDELRRNKEKSRKT